jgi:hypothetical protein
MPVAPIPGSNRHQTDIDLAHPAFNIFKNGTVAGVAGKIN